MRADNHIGIGTKDRQTWIVKRLAHTVKVVQTALMLHHIQSCKTDFAALDTIDQRIRVDQGATGTVNNNHVLLHLCNGIYADHMIIILGCRCMEGNNITLFIKSLQICILRILLHFVIFIEIISQHLTAKSAQVTNHGTTDPAGSDDSNGAVRQFPAQFSFQGIILNGSPLHNMLHLATAHQHHHDCVIRYTVR